MPLSHIEHILVVADDIDATRDWYARVLGMQSGPHPDFGFPVHWMYIDGVDIVHIGPSAKQAGDIQKKYLGRTSQQSEAGTGALHHIAFPATGLRAVTIMAPARSFLKRDTTSRSFLKGDTTSRRSPIERKSTHGSGANQTTVSRSRATQQVASALLEPARAPRRICGSGKRRPVSDSEGGLAERWIAVDSQGKQRNLDTGADQRQPVYHHVPSAHGLRGTQHPAQLLRRD